MAWMDELWDDDHAMLWAFRRDKHLTRETAWYALGLLQRAADGDHDRTVRALESVIDNQVVAPGYAYDGTFLRAPEEPEPDGDAVMWVHYDPNWRQFIGTTLALICDGHGDVLGAHLEERVRGSIERTIAGEPADRVSPTYANIALMKAWLETWSGRDATAFAREIAAAFDKHGAFLEYNSPTYYGIDLFALALWRTAPEPLASLGGAMGAALWRDIGRFYHAGLRNLCGPYDRAYGMDMTSHATPLGLWIWEVVGAERAPFPDTTTRFHHPHDICFAPCVTATDLDVPAEVVADLQKFNGERTLEQTITSEPRRVATAWLGDDVMFGGWHGPASGIGWHQRHHATIHWRRPNAGVGWVRLSPEAHADATATPGELWITTSAPGSLDFDVHPSARVEGSTWHVEGMSFDVETHAQCADSDGGRITYSAGGPTTLVIGVRRSR